MKKHVFYVSVNSSYLIHYLQRYFLTRNVFVFKLLINKIFLNGKVNSMNKDTNDSHGCQSAIKKNGINTNVTKLLGSQ